MLETLLWCYSDNKNTRFYEKVDTISVYATIGKYGKCESGKRIYLYYL